MVYLEWILRMEVPMIKCDIRGCEAFATEPGRVSIIRSFFSGTRGSDDRAMLARWIILKPCLCGADQRKEACKCNLTCSPLWGIIPVQHWPNLDWWAFGGVDRLILCPDHRVLIAKFIATERMFDPTMDPGDKYDPSNRH